MSQSSISSDLIRGHIDTIVLSILFRSDSYGYDIYKTIIQRSMGRYVLKEPSIYSAFRRLEEQKCITSYWGEETQGGRRKYYSITDEGRRVLAENLRAWDYAKRMIDMLLYIGSSAESAACAKGTVCIEDTADGREAACNNCEDAGTGEDAGAGCASDAPYIAEAGADGI